MSQFLKKIKKGVLWVYIGRFVGRSLNVIKIPILSYLLSPEDFGLMGIVYAILSYLDVLTRTGFDRALIQKREVDNYWDVTWTLNVMKGFVQAVILLIIIKPITVFYDEPALDLMLKVCLLIPILTNLKSIKLIHLEKHLKLREITIYVISTNIVSMIITLLFAYYLRNVWALVIGQIAFAVYAFVASYGFAPYRPRFDFDVVKMKVLWTYGKWIFLSSLIFSTLAQFDILFIGRMLGLSLLGYYVMAYNIGRVLPTELVFNLRQVFFPAFSSIQDDLPRLREAFLKTYTFNIMLGGLISVGMFFLSEDLVSIFLADKWRPIVSPLRVFAVWTFFQFMLATFPPLFMAIGKPDYQTKAQTVQLCIMILTIYPCTVKFGITGTAMSVLISAVCVIPYMLFLIQKCLECPWGKLMRPIFLSGSSIGILYFMAVYWNKCFNLPAVANFMLLGIAICSSYLIAAWVIDLKVKTGIFVMFKQFIFQR